MTQYHGLEEKLATEEGVVRLHFLSLCSYSYDCGNSSRLLILPKFMIIPITCPDGQAEWIVLDLQGTITPEGGTIDGLTIGHMDERGKTVTARIGNHSLTGEVVVLKKPLILIRKKSSTEGAEVVSDGTTEYEVAGVIKRKLLFDVRPQPIIGGSGLVKHAEPSPV